MHQLASGVTAGSSLALVLKLLNWADQSPVPFAPVCDAIAAADWRFDPTSFATGIIVGVLLYGFIELVITFRWALIQWSSSKACGEAWPAKARYKILG